MNLSTILRNMLCALMLLCGLRLDAAASSPLAQTLRQLGSTPLDLAPATPFITKAGQLKELANDLTRQKDIPYAVGVYKLRNFQDEVFASQPTPGQSIKEQAEATKQQLMRSPGRPTKPAPRSAPSTSSISLPQVLRNLGIVATYMIKQDPNYDGSEEFLSTPENLKQYADKIKDASQDVIDVWTSSDPIKACEAMLEYYQKNQPRSSSSSSSSRTSPTPGSSSSRPEPTVYLIDDSGLDTYQKQLNELYKSWAMWLNGKVEDYLFFSSYVIGLTGIYNVEKKLNPTIKSWIESLYIKGGYGVDSLTKIVAYEMCNDPRNLRLDEKAFKETVIQNITSYLGSAWTRDDLSNSMNSIFRSFCIGSKLSENEDRLVTEIVNVTPLGNINLLYEKCRDQIESYWNLAAIQNRINEELPKTILDICKRRINWGISKYRPMKGRQKLAEKLLDIIFAELYQTRGISLDRNTLIGTVYDIIYAVGSRGRTLDMALAESSCNRICNPAALTRSSSSSSFSSSSSSSSSSWTSPSSSSSSAFGGGSGFSADGGFGSSSSSASQPSGSSSLAIQTTINENAVRALEDMPAGKKFTKKGLDKLKESYNERSIKNEFDKLPAGADSGTNQIIGDQVINQTDYGLKMSAVLRDQTLQDLLKKLAALVAYKTNAMYKPVSGINGSDFFKNAAIQLRKVLYLMIDNSYALEDGALDCILGPDFTDLSRSSSFSSGFGGSPGSLGPKHGPYSVKRAQDAAAAAQRSTSSSSSSGGLSTNRATDVLKNLTDSKKFTRFEIDAIANNGTINDALKAELITCSDYVKSSHVQSGIMNEVKNGPQAKSPRQSEFLQRLAGAVGQRVMNKTYNRSAPPGALYGAWLSLSANAVRQVFYLLTQGIPFEDAINTAGPK